MPPGFPTEALASVTPPPAPGSGHLLGVLPPHGRRAPVDFEEYAAVAEAVDEAGRLGGEPAAKEGRLHSPPSESGRKMLTMAYGEGAI